MSGYQWIHVDVRKGIPDSAFKGGEDTGGAPIYIGRAIHEGNLFPAKVIPAYGKAYVSYNGREIVKYDIELLLQKGVNFGWEHGMNGYIPPNAVVGGYTVSGETLYIGRVDYKGSKTIGKVAASQRGIILAYGGEEILINGYEVLVRK